MFKISSKYLDVAFHISNKIIRIRPKQRKWRQLIISKMSTKFTDFNVCYKIH